MKSPQSYTDCHGVKTLTVSIRQKDILISGPINVNTLNISLNMKNVEISILIYMQNASHHRVAKLLKVAPLRPGLVRLAIFFIEAFPKNKYVVFGNYFVLKIL